MFFLLVNLFVPSRTPLHWAAVKGHAKCVEGLLDLGVSPSPMDLDGGTPLQYSIQAGQAETTKLLEVWERGTAGGKVDPQQEKQVDSTGEGVQRWHQEEEVWFPHQLARQEEKRQVTQQQHRQEAGSYIWGCVRGYVSTVTRGRCWKGRPKIWDK